MIKIQQLEFHYRQGEFNLNIPEFQISGSEKVAVIGPSGSGKTTFGLQYLCYGANNDENCIYITIGEPVSHVEKYVQFNMNLKELAEEGKLLLVDTKLIKLSDLSEILKEAVNKTDRPRTIMEFQNNADLTQ